MFAATISKQTLKDGKISYSLKGVERYNKLRKETVTPPRILVVLFLPPDREKWLKWSEDELALRKCAWWVSLRSAPATENTTSQTVYLPEYQHFHSNGLRDIMTRLSKEEELDYAE